MRKVLVLGSGGAGKSTFARRLGEALNIEVVHLDSFYWRPGWIEPPKEEWDELVESLLTRESWVMDGNFGGTLELRAEACDTIVFLDRSRWLCLWRVIKRRLQYRNNVRPDMAPGCNEKIDLEFLLWVLLYPEQTRPKVEAVIERFGPGRRICRLQTEQQVEDFFDTLCFD
ncbi:MAG: AAA family ATPase [Blastocatellales bacterium]